MTGMASYKNRAYRYTPEMETLSDFFCAFPLQEARSLLHQMMRAAFARQNTLAGKDVRGLLFLRDEILKLVTAAEMLARSNAHKTNLEKFFRCWPAEEWNETLNAVFYAAVYDGFFTRPPVHGDIYHFCRGLHALIKACADIHEGNNQPKPIRSLNR